MPKSRTTGCMQQHYGPNCADCTRVRVRRFRARSRGKRALRLPLSEVQRQTNAAASYVRTYLKRGAIAPPDACERCELEVQVSPSRPLRQLRFFHPDPSRPQLVAWLCADCRRHIRATREPLTLRWQWPGLTAHRSRKALNLTPYIAASHAVFDAKLPPATTSLRQAAFIGTLIRALAPGERERLFATASLAGPRWQPTADMRLDALLRAWAFTERTERGISARSAAGMLITPLPAEPRRQRSVLPTPPPSSSRPPFDAEAAWNAIQGALQRLDEAEAEAARVNARVAASIE